MSIDIDLLYRSGAIRFVDTATGTSVAVKDLQDMQNDDSFVTTVLGALRLLATNSTSFADALALLSAQSPLLIDPTDQPAFSGRSENPAYPGDGTGISVFGYVTLPTDYVENGSDKVLVDETGRIKVDGWTRILVHEVAHAIFGTVDTRDLLDGSVANPDYEGGAVAFENLVALELEASGLSDGAQRTSYSAIWTAGSLDIPDNPFGIETDSFTFGNVVELVLQDTDSRVLPNGEIDTGPGADVNTENNTDQIDDLIIATVNHSGSFANNISTGRGQDYIYAGLGNDTVDGGEGSDYIHLGTGSDTGIGGAGDDIIVGDNLGPYEVGGDDTLYGGDHDDWLFGVGGNDTLYGGQDQDSLVGGSGADALFGGEGRDVLSGGSDDDTLSGDAGDDHLIGGAGADVIDGGDGWDAVYFESDAGPVSIDLAGGTGEGGDAAGDTYANVEVFVGTSGGDQFTTSGTQTVVIGGGAGADVFNIDKSIGEGDLSQRSSGVTVVLGGEGSDVYNIGGPAGPVLLIEVPGLTEDNLHLFDLEAAATSLGYQDFSAFDIVVLNPDEQDILQINGETLSIGPGSAALSYTNPSHSSLPSLFPVPAYETFLLSGEQNTDFGFHAAGTGLIDIGGAEGVQAQFLTNGFYAGYYSVHYHLSEGNWIEYLSYLPDEIPPDVTIFYESGILPWSDSGYPEQPEGEALLPPPDGYEGDEYLDTSASQFFVYWVGYTNNYYFENSNNPDYLGNFALIGGALQGNTLISDGTHAVTVQWPEDGGFSITDFLAETEYVDSSDGTGENGSSGTQISGTSASEQIFGTDDNDLIYDLDGDDTVSGGAGNDTFVAGGGADTYFGGGGTGDVIDYGSSTQGLLIDLGNPLNSTGIAAGDTFDGIEQIVGSAHDDIIVGSAHVQSLFGGAGNDYLNGSQGDDYLHGGLGNDDLTGGTGADTFVFSSESNGTDTVHDFESGVDKLYFTNGGTIASALTIIETIDGVVLSWGYGNSILLSNTTESELSISDLLFETELGVLSKEVRNYDDGRVQETIYLDGVKTTVTLSDLGDAHSWSSYVDIFNANGQMISREMTYDDGRVALSSYTDGSRVSTFITDDGNQFNWESVEKLYGADGQLLSQTYLYDDGREVETSYVDGIRTSIVTTDHANSYVWTSYVDVFDALGTLSSRTMTYDDGLVEATVYDSSNVQAWESYVDVFSSSGDLVTREMTYDDGRVALSSYTEGNRLSTFITDDGDQFNWESVEKLYGADGQLLSQTYLYDDGNLFEMMFSDGTRTESIRTDSSDLYDWATIIDTFDFTGALETRTTTYDDGSTAILVY
ncbi:calcium-binding protein [Loktanella sp. IMCC34160]|uniref:calcium-binding protein n=1 Tax=Loktanella sp. IMCC34160 TaxID=2510646 RepID=UPI00101C8D1A|nr:calcium-binding protein [Loktanella sp. IMCC34160]RYG89925.1 calcium-binding protein [Loktanella sp. IMCC34160]